MSYALTSTLSSSLAGILLCPLHRSFYNVGLHLIDKNSFNLIQSDKDWSRAKALIPFMSLITLIAAQHIGRDCKFVNVYAMTLPSLMYECYLTHKTEDASNIYSHIKGSSSSLGTALNWATYALAGWTFKNIIYK